jgi:hypothetical protein
VICGAIPTVGTVPSNLNSERGTRLPLSLRQQRNALRTTTAVLAKMIPAAQWSGQGPSTATRSDTPADSASNMQPNAPNPRPNLQSCQFCRKRKIKCDKLEGGCSQCSRAQTDCVYPASQRKGRPRKAGTNRPPPAPTQREAQLLKKIWKLERVVASMAGGNPPLVGEGAVGNMVRESVKGNFNDVAYEGRIILMMRMMKRPGRSLDVS